MASVGYDLEKSLENTFWDDVRSVCSRVPNGMSQEPMQNALWAYADAAILDTSVSGTDLRRQMGENLMSVAAHCQMVRQAKLWMQEIDTLANNCHELLYPDLAEQRKAQSR